MQMQPYTEALEKALGGVIARANAELAGVKERMDAAVAAANARVAESEARLAALDARIADRLSTLKDGEPGTSVTVDDVAPLIASEIERRVADLPPPEAGTSVTVDDVRPVLQAMVDALPKAKNGDPGAGVTIDDVLPAIMSEIERRVTELPAAEPGKSITVDDVRPLLQAMVEELPKAKDGTSVTLDDVLPAIVAEIEQRAESFPAFVPEEIAVDVALATKMLAGFVPHSERQPAVQQSSAQPITLVMPPVEVHMPAQAAPIVKVAPAEAVVHVQVPPRGKEVTRVTEWDNDGRIKAFERTEV